MVRDERISRRRVLRLAGSGSAVAFAAGCLGTDDTDRGGAGIEADSPSENESDPTETDGEPAQNESDTEPVDNGTDDEPAENETAGKPTDNETDGESTNEETGAQTDGDGTEDDETDAEENDGVSAVDPNVDIVLKATTSGWEGTKPEAVAGETNPTLVLEAGAEYSITWKNADGKPHNIEIWNEQEEVVGGHETELLSEKGETQTIEFVATEEMVEYACEIHYDWGHRAPIEVTAPE